MEKLGLDINKNVWEKGYTGKNITIALIGTPEDNETAKTVLFGPDYFSNPEKFKDRIISFDDISKSSLTSDKSDLRNPVSLLRIKILDKHPEPDPDFEELIQAIRWVCTHKDRYKVNTLSMTLSKENMLSNKKLIQAMENASKSGIIITIKPKAQISNAGQKQILS